MTHVIHVGPVESGEGPFHLLCAANDAGVLPPGAGPTLESAAAELLPHLAGAGVVTCDLSLAPIASKMGWRLAEADRQVALVRMSLALSVAHGPELLKVAAPDLVLQVCQAAADYHRAGPWERFESDLALSLVAKGALDGEHELSVLGAAGEEFGLALYDKPGSVAFLAEGGADSAPDRAAGLDSLAILLDGREPRYLVDAVKAVTGVAIAPMLIRMRRGREVAPSGDDLRLLVAAMRAVANLGAAGLHATATFESQGRRAEARVSVVGAAALEALPAAPDYTGVGRNEPCPCGSGRKFKKCHGDGEPPRAPGPSQRKSRLHDLDAQVTRRLCAFAVARFGDAFRRRVEDAELGGPEFSMHHCLHGLRFDGKSVGEHAQNEPKEVWSSDERAWLGALQRGVLSLWEVEAISSEGQLALLDLVTQTRCVVLDVSAAKSLGFRVAVLARVVTHDGESVMCGTWPASLRPSAAHQLLDALNEKLRSKRVSAEQLQEPSTAEALVHLVREATKPRAANENKAQIRNTDGEQVLFTKDRLRFEAAKRSEVVERLRGLEGMHLDENSPAKTEFTVSKGLNAVHPAWRRTLLGTLRVQRDLLELESNSVARADALRRRVEAALAGLATFQVRSHEDPMAQLPSFGDALSIDAQCLAMGPWVETLMRLEMESGWLRSKPASLDGLTPVEAMKRKALRDQVHWSVKEMEHARSDDAATRGLRLRRALGLSSTGAHLKPDEAWSWLGGGLSLSDALTAFVAPMLPDIEGDEQAACELALKVGVAVWNALVLDGGEDGRVAAAVREALKGVAPGQAERLRAEVPWLVRRKQHLFAEDRRRVMQTVVETEKGRIGLKVAWTAPEELRKRLHRLGMQGGDRALDLYDPAQPPLEFSWKAVGAGYREELVLEYHRRTKAPFGKDLLRHVRLHVLAEDADCASFPQEAVETLDRLTGEGMSRHEALHVVGEALLANG